MIQKELHLKILYSIYLVIITCKDVLLYFESKIFLVDIIILYGTFNLHKSKRSNSKSKPCFEFFMFDYALITKN